MRSMERFGESKYEAKLSGEMKNGIYSYSTAKAYNRDCQRFATYAIEQHGNRYMTLEDARVYVSDYMRSEIEAGKSAYTLKAERSALAKLYGVEGKSICELPDRKRADITRSRDRLIRSEKTGKMIKNPSSRAGHFSEKNHRELVDFCKSTGLRRSELETLRGDQLLRNSDGSYSIHLNSSQCKGGRERELPVIGNVENVVDLMERAGTDRVFERVPGAMDVHHYRREYASALYKSIARPIDEIKDSNCLYRCRGDQKGVVFDREAMRIVSNALGHNRVSVIAEHYLR